MKKECPNGCWELFLSKDKKGRFRFQIEKKGKSFFAHRASAIVYLGLDLDDEETQVLHKNSCHNNCCWNPDHIYLGDARDNHRDAMEYGLKKIPKKEGRPHE